MLATAESCTGGLVAALLTEIPGSSAVVERGFVTYSNEAKTDMLGVPADLIAAHGAVSEPVARAMAEGALAHSRADVAVAITGVAGPSGGSDDEAGRARPFRAGATRRDDARPGAPLRRSRPRAPFAGAPSRMPWRCWKACSRTSAADQACCGPSLLAPSSGPRPE